MPSLWLIDPQTLPAHNSQGGRFGDDPLINLLGLQQAIADGGLGEDDVFLATDTCDSHLQDLQWSMRTLLDCIACLRPADHRGAHWCDDGYGKWFPCDAYAICFDEVRRCRSPAALKFYLKFSIDEEGSLMLVVISAHLSRHRGL